MRMAEKVSFAHVRAEIHVIFDRRFSAAFRQKTMRIVGIRKAGMDDVRDVFVVSQALKTQSGIIQTCI